MFFAYILQSEKDQKYYYGHSSDLDLRLKSHNQGKVRSTKYRRPFKLIYFESFSTKKEAIQRERFFKSKAGYAWLKNQGII
ncbi:MAG: GIY-YIG nuclease family protein [Calditrichaceae bacterium]|nr:GIY-YIG nuclease family protein [Calditrichaceae bacterium]MBN2709953.1 GIY-YIG nuclease family protein [Calditrichaceae bacterium]RQV94213.1 MAG: GIY-YIG nuclease family protein [Calditrichota bacterium]